MSEVVMFVAAALALCLIMAAAWQMQRASGNDGWADVFWSFGVGMVGVGTVLLAAEKVSPARPTLVASLLTLWSLRLGGHILSRTLKSDDDPRYAKLRKQWGKAAARRMFVFLQSQALAGVVLVICVYIAARRPGSHLDFFDYCGALIMLVALTGETVADWQLKRFGNDPSNRGKICDEGLWRWSRHPNYFFEWLGWISYVLIATGPGGGYSYGWITLAAPVLMYGLLRHVSGVPPLEEHMLATRGKAYRDYQRRTSIFFPFPPNTEKRLLKL
ncbi:steroid 5-alpha reductase family enzyme [Phyllobacterium sp. 1468]|uniref:DUF1295 domain-containing protein n=1 Tax=Phyllobacterium sp. 1468 TaxID=2817759 RepID=UPI002867471D|nr:DUF1295 domain-containing protein [Phyllobacterium sp. 1468]MDR6632086.1 steroid 5-alpha reductase family enzyme [Phyllobacterium sp. 1468]